MNVRELVIECSNCHLQFYASELQVSESTNELTCVNCLRQPGSAVSILKDRPLKQAKPAPEPPLPRLYIVSKRQQPQRAVNVPAGHSLFHCETCRYEFSRKSSFSGSCPYCSNGRLRLLRSN